MTLRGDIAAILVALSLTGCALSPGPCGPPTENVTWAKEPAMLRPITYWRRVERSIGELKAACAQENDADAAAAAWGICYNAHVLRNYLGSIHSLSRKPYIEKLSVLMATATEISEAPQAASRAESKRDDLDGLVAGIAQDAPEIFHRPAERHSFARGGARTASHAR